MRFYSSFSCLLSFTLVVQGTSSTTPIPASGSAFALQPNTAKSVVAATVTGGSVLTPPLFDAPTTTALSFGTPSSTTNTKAKTNNGVRSNMLGGGMVVTVLTVAAAWI
ncbi:hypothetical protein DL98DRAFT_607090 [Cadophora sp. DSE1049]|nr:hypothetical protein DL98DRAFT_607090 [Cadophora sp. DSE1049]